MQNGRLRRLARRWEGLARPNRQYQELLVPGEQHKRSWSTPSIPDEWEGGRGGGAGPAERPDLPRLDSVTRRRSRESCRSSTDDWGADLWESDPPPLGGGGRYRGGGYEGPGAGGVQRGGANLFRGSMGRVGRSLSSSSSERGGQEGMSSGRGSTSDMSSPVSTEGDSGHLVTVLVGRNRTPFTVNAVYLDHSCLKVLVDQARRHAYNTQERAEARFAPYSVEGNRGPIRGLSPKRRQVPMLGRGPAIPGHRLWLDCDEVLFEHVIWLITNGDPSIHHMNIATLQEFYD